jgi:hypothetical protein
VTLNQLIVFPIVFSFGKIDSRSLPPCSKVEEVGHEVTCGLNWTVSIRPIDPLNHFFF